MKTYQFNMTLSANDNVSQDEILDKLVELSEANGWSLGGGLIELDDDGNEIDPTQAE